MRMSTSLPRVALVAALLLAACSPASPTPSPTPSDPVEAFRAAMSADDLNLAASLTGTLTITGDQSYPIHGALTIDGADTRTLTTMAGPVGIEAWEQVVDGGAASTRRGIEPWSEPLQLPDGATGLRAALASLGPLEDLGPEVVDGQSLRHLRASDVPLRAADVGLADGGEAEPATLDIWLAADGTPVTMQLIAGPLTLDLDPIRMGGAPVIDGPPELAVLQSPALHYAIVHPADWEVSERGSSGHLIGLDGGYVISYCAGGDIELPGWVTEGTAFYSGLWDAEPESSEQLVVEAASGPVPATLTTWHGTSEGEPAYILDLAIVADGVACDLQWFSPPGNEAADRARFEQIVAGFRLGG